MTAVSPQMQSLIRARLDEIAREEDITILLAIESGSRAWGFHSEDSDYDVRFIYARPVDWHLRIEKRRDVVERPISDELDLSGWELSKALNLALRSNAVVAEWLQSPISYSEAPGFRADTLAFCRDVLTRKNVTWHYLSMTHQSQTRILDAEGKIKLKRYFYSLRPALALRWMRLNAQAVPPMDMTNLMAGCDLPEAVTTFIRNLIDTKRQAREMGTATASHSETDALIASELAAAETWLKSTPKPEKHGFEAANRLHRLYTRHAGEHEA
ncbi:nucleotidyltransferase domain-containing protein [Halovulum sp. GXIMD14793]